MVTASVGFDEVLYCLRVRMGRAGVQDIVALARTPTEEEDGQGTMLTYVRPSSLMVIADNPPLLAAATALDEKYDRLVAPVTSC